MAGDSQDPGLRDEKIGGHDEMKGRLWRGEEEEQAGKELEGNFDVIPFPFGSAIGEVDLPSFAALLIGSRGRRAARAQSGVFFYLLLRAFHSAFLTECRFE